MSEMPLQHEAATGDETAERPESDAAAFHWNDASGLYRSTHPAREELRIDVDGCFPQLTASGTIRSASDSQLHWVANLTAAGSDRWTGAIWHKDGAAALLPHTEITVTAQRTPFGIGQTASVRFSGGGSADNTRTYLYASRYFRAVEFEFDRVKDAPARADSNRPAIAPCETLSIEQVFRRAGLTVSQSGGDEVLPMAAAGDDDAWSDMELHDAMQAYWSRFAGKTPRAMWMLFAGRHEAGLGGIGFDDIGPNRGQGAVLFGDAGNQVWTACREMGHPFEVAHGWPESPAMPWIPRGDALAARGLMDGRCGRPGGRPAFPFSDRELQIMRHAPERLAPAGNADWFDRRGFAPPAPHAALRLHLSTDRTKAAFEFLEPVVLDLRLTNVSGRPVTVDERLLEAGDDMTVVIKKDGKPARRWVPYCRTRCRPAPTSLVPARSLHRSLFAAAGRNGWDLAEPGLYDVQVMLRHGGENLLSNRLRLRIAEPRSCEEETLAQDFFSGDVGRILAFDGSRALEAGNDVLNEVVHRLGDRRVACHARVALAHPMGRTCKQLVLGAGPQRMTSAAAAGGRIKIIAAKPDLACKSFLAALMRAPDRAAETLGHVDYKDYVDRLSRWLSERNDPRAAAACQDRLHKALAQRRVAADVLLEVAQRRDAYRIGADSAKQNKTQ